MDEFDEIYDEMKGRMEELNRKFQEVNRRDIIEKKQRAKEALKETGRNMQEYVQENPWKATVIGFAMGMLMGMIIRSSKE